MCPTVKYIDSWSEIYRKISNIRRTKSQILNDSPRAAVFVQSIEAMC